MSYRLVDYTRSEYEIREEIENTNRMISDFKYNIKNKNSDFENRMLNLVRKLGKEQQKVSVKDIIQRFKEAVNDDSDPAAYLEYIENMISILKIEIVATYKKMFIELNEWDNMWHDDMYGANEYVERMLNIYNKLDVTFINTIIDGINNTIEYISSLDIPLNTYTKLFEHCMITLKQDIDSFNRLSSNARALYCKLFDEPSSNKDKETLYDMLESVFNDMKENEWSNYNIALDETPNTNVSIKLIDKFVKNTKTFNDIYSIINNRVQQIRWGTYNPPCAETYNYFLAFNDMRNLVLNLIETEYNTITKQCELVLDQITQRVDDLTKDYGTDESIELLKIKTKEVLKLKPNNRLQDVLDILESKF